MLPVNLASTVLCASATAKNMNNEIETTRLSESSSKNPPHFVQTSEETASSHATAGDSPPSSSLKKRLFLEMMTVPSLTLPSLVNFS
ncbi:MAG: hypothetical protein EOM12_18820 [Verrucomicrobiae bacterium]|nr:hypothetical protein [Verrucomicrobiae bacterium]